MSNSMINIVNDYYTTEKVVIKSELKNGILNQITIFLHDDALTVENTYYDNKATYNSLPSNKIAKDSDSKYFILSELDKQTTVYGVTIDKYFVSVSNRVYVCVVYIHDFGFVCMTSKETYGVNKAWFTKHKPHLPIDNSNINTSFVDGLNFMTISSNDSGTYNTYFSGCDKNEYIYSFYSNEDIEYINTVLTNHASNDKQYNEWVGAIKFNDILSYTRDDSMYGEGTGTHIQPQSEITEKSIVYYKSEFQEKLESLPYGLFIESDYICIEKIYGFYKQPNSDVLQVIHWIYEPDNKVFTEEQACLKPRYYDNYTEICDGNFFDRQNRSYIIDDIYSNFPKGSDVYLLFDPAHGSELKKYFKFTV